MSMIRKTVFASFGVVLGSAGFSVAAAPVTYDGIEFPGGNASFADEVIAYNPSHSGGNVPTDSNFTDPQAAVGAPDYSSSNGSVSLGAGGLIELHFTDNMLTTSGSSDDDLHIFEIGPDVEDTFVAVRPTAATYNLLSPSFSANPDGYFSVGSVSGATSSIDIDSIFGGFAAGALEFDAVQLIDDPVKGQRSGPTVGADIDAVGAIASAPPANQVPEPGSLVLLAGGLLAGGAFRGLKRR